MSVRWIYVSGVILGFKSSKFVIYHFLNKRIPWDCFIKIPMRFYESFDKLFYTIWEETIAYYVWIHGYVYCLSVVLRREIASIVYFIIFFSHHSIVFQSLYLKWMLSILLHELCKRSRIFFVKMSVVLWSVVLYCET